ncbi:nickel/cobalt transporter [Taklimakanibacter lacteus]|uniref:nickel/cobalt transporter n=1 Tax=Taklimakanibacter lacteus TaxID=2268456 RepID=UPI0034D7B586
MKLIARLLAGLMLLCLVAAVLPTQGFAQDQQGTTAPRIDQRKLLVPPRNADGTFKAPPFWSDPALWIMIQQRNFYGAMDNSIKQLKAQSSFAAATTLILLSFGYGVFHAAGPGHGKTVISAWLLATENELRRGILIAFMSAVIQALTAIMVISTLLLLVTAVGSTARDVGGFLESASYALIGLMGAYLIWTALRPHNHEVAHAHSGHDHGHLHHDHPGHHHDHHGHAHHDHHAHNHDHDAHCDCGHAHVPTARQVKGEWSMTKAFSLAFAVGIRPCTGALLVLVSANFIGIYWAGITSTFIMALGTAITVSIIATIAVYSKKLAISLAKRDAAWLGYAAFGLRLGGGLVILALGAIMFWGSLFTTNTMM